MGFIWSQLFVRLPYPSHSFSGQTVIVTGSNVGLGKEAARHFARLDAAKVILAVRNTTAGEEAAKDIQATTGRNVCEVWKLDLGSYESVKEFAARASKLPRIDVLLENAGIAVQKFKMMEKDESMVTVNVVSTFLLALLLLPKLQETKTKFNTTPTITIVSSEVHGWVKFTEWQDDDVFATLSDEKKAKMSERYPLSKLLEVLVIKEIAPKINGVTLNMLNPGLCHSSLSREGSIVLEIMKFLIARSTEYGSRTLVQAAEAGPESHGKYCNDATIDDAMLSDFVKSDDGKQAQKAIWAGLKQKLDTIQPGVTDVLAK